MTTSTVPSAPGDTAAGRVEEGGPATPIEQTAMASAVPGATGEPSGVDSGSPGSSGDSPVRKALQTVGLVITPTSLLTALLYYFGWARTSSQARYLGLDVSVFGFSTQDYLLSSISAMYLPVGVGLVLALLWLVAHGYLLRSLHATPLVGRRRTRLRVLVAVLAGAGGLCCVTGVYAAFVRSSELELVGPLGFGLGIALVGYAAYLISFFSPSRPSDRAEPGWLPGLKGALLALLIAVSLFWAVSDYAVAVGEGRTQQLLANLASRSDVTVYSPQRLHLDGAGVRETDLGEADSAYRFQYAGLKLLLRADDKYFLLPAGWTPSDGTTVVVPDAGDLRFEFDRP